MCVFTNALAWVWELWDVECCSLFPSCRAGDQAQVNRHRDKHIYPLLIRLGLRSVVQNGASSQTDCFVWFTPFPPLVFYRVLASYN